jgi:uncharacterized protein YoxC
VTQQVTIAIKGELDKIEQFSTSLASLAQSVSELSEQMKMLGKRLEGLQVGGTYDGLNDNIAD